MVRLDGLGGRRPNQLSGGQRQRVALARAVINEPEVLLLDEPLGALDLKLRQEMQIELKQIQKEVGITFVYVTHDQEEALTMSDRMAVMSNGRIEQIGPPVEVYERPATEFVAGFIGISNVLRARRRALRGPAGEDPHARGGRESPRRHVRRARRGRAGRLRGHDRRATSSDWTVGSYSSRYARIWTPRATPRASKAGGSGWPGRPITRTSWNERTTGEEGDMKGIDRETGCAGCGSRRPRRPRSWR